ncbi:hypothetical protein OA501_02880 [Flavobacteriaceae bacterium]|nr:hypothetical protein [Flavobacteriaceae bacterium]
MIVISSEGSVRIRYEVSRIPMDILAGGISQGLLNLFLKPA